MRQLGSALLGAALAVTFASTAEARPLEAVDMGGRKIRIDGLLREWPKHLDRLDEVVRGRRQDGDPDVRGVVGYDDENLYVAADVEDADLVRTRGFGAREDRLDLAIAFPKGRGYKTYTVRIYAGQPGKSAGAVKIAGGHKVRGAKVVESTSKRGYYVEASIPWTTFPEARRLRAGLRAALSYHDADRPGAVKAVVGTSKATRGKRLPALLSEGETGLYATLEDKNLPKTPAFIQAGDISGNKMQEVVAVYGSFLTVVGSHYRGGKEFFFQDMGVGGASAVRRLEVRDLTGDGKDDILVVKRVGSKEAYREVLQVLSVSEGDEAPFSAFEHEVGVVTEDLSIINDVDVKREKGKVALVISQGKTKDVDPDTYEEPLPGNMPSALMPWDETKSVSYVWDGKKFEKAGEKTWKPKMDPPTRAARAGALDPGASVGSAGPPAPPPPRPPSADELMGKVYALYRKDRGVGKGKPRFDFVTDVAGDTTTERVLVHGKDLVVFGAAFKGGLSYVYITVGVEDAKDILDVTARDLTGDGKAEVIVRGLLHAQASKELGGDVVDRHALYIYNIGEDGIRRIFAAETGRSLGENSILGLVRFLPEGRKIRLELRPGRAVGWSEGTYPFPIDRAPYGGLEPLLVPWSDQDIRSYAFDGTDYVQR